ncbi:NAD-dependent epimerase/dehydratase family protein [Merismopedia glauca]|uniref:Epimerase n=1 Tax=Merismopedia glauca CCAP 1448/3 TaxID=1296344 RepID=A0A2T1C3P0_9CYAN|nr:NAD(P)-dependent oxidoreductase [Merismopedia glauca]PSB02733.1 epimerase [Merismopedia glauca CCAP 1448/3]
MSPKKIFITGASGCIGQYISELLIQETDYELYLLVRNPDKLKINYQARSGVNILVGDLQEIEKFSDLLPTMNQAILTAAAWGGELETTTVNITKTLKLLSLLSLENCEQVIYFSTASILDRDHNLLSEAGEIGTEYIRTKYECFTRLPEVAIAPRITSVFPTLVFGGGSDNKPLSHLSGGLSEVVKYIDIIRHLKADGSFHFIHGQDIAQVVLYLIQHPGEYAGQKLVLGNQCLTADEAVEQACHYLGKKVSWRIPLSLGLANVIINVFRIQMAAWDRFCLQYRHFNYHNPVNPARLGMKAYYPTLDDIFRTSGVSKN